MRVLLVYPDIDTHTPIYFQIGVGSLSAVLKAEGHETRFLRVAELDREQFLSDVRGWEPDLIGFSSVFVQWKFVKQMARWLKEDYPRPIIAGGAHPTLDPEDALQCESIDWICRGEGEYVLRDVVRCLEAGEAEKIPGLENIWCRGEDGKVIRNPERELISPLDELPPPDREFFDYDEALAQMSGNLQVMTSRGCPYRCTYCSNEAMMRMYQGNGRFIRQRSVGHVINEIVTTCERHPSIRYLSFSDDIITENKKWFFPFLEEYKEKVGLPFNVQVQMQTFDRETARRMAEAGCYQAIIAMESGDEYIRREVMNRNLSDEEIVSAYRYCDEMGIETCSYNIVGVPGETEQSIRKSIEMVKLVKPDNSLVFKFTPFPGTKLYDVCKERGYLREDANYDSYFTHVGFLDLPTISKERLTELYYEFIQTAREVNELKRASRLGSYFDFFENFEGARIKARSQEFVGKFLLGVNRDVRMALLVHPDSELTYKIDVRPGSKLRFAITMSPEDWDRHASSVDFRIEARAGLFRKTEVFHRELNPRQHRDHRDWQECEVDLSAFAGKRIELAFQTRARGTAMEYCSSYFGNPIVVEAA